MAHVGIALGRSTGAPDLAMARSEERAVKMRCSPRRPHLVCSQLEVKGGQRRRFHRSARRPLHVGGRSPRSNDTCATLSEGREIRNGVHHGYDRDGMRAVGAWIDASQGHLLLIDAHPVHVRHIYLFYLFFLIEIQSHLRCMQHWFYFYSRHQHHHHPSCLLRDFWAVGILIGHEADRS